MWGEQTKQGSSFIFRFRKREATWYSPFKANVIIVAAVATRPCKRQLPCHRFLGLAVSHSFFSVVKLLPKGSRVGRILVIYLTNIYIIISRVQQPYNPLNLQTKCKLSWRSERAVFCKYVQATCQIKISQQTCPIGVFLNFETFRQEVQVTSTEPAPRALLWNAAIPAATLRTSREHVPGSAEASTGKATTCEPGCDATWNHGAEG